MQKARSRGVMERAEATYQYLEEAHGNGMFFYTDCCRNRMFSIENNPMRYHGCLCPKCLREGKMVTLYLRGTSDGIRVFEAEYGIKIESEVEK
jgi:hypothetical protein